MAAVYATLILDEADSAGALLSRGWASIALTARVPDPPDGLIFGQAGAQAQFSEAASPQVLLPCNDTFGPVQGNGTPGTAYTITYNGVPGSPVSWSFILAAGPVSFTATSASPCVFTFTPSAALTGLPDGTGVKLSGASLPAGFTAGTTYFVVAQSGYTFSLAATEGGTPIASTSTGSGSLTVAQWRLSALATMPAAAPLSIAVTSVFGRSGAVTAQAGDYAAYYDALGDAAAAQAAAEAASLPLPSGTPAAGDVPVASGSGEATAWGPSPGGTVTAVSVASANGFAGTVANPSTTPAITVSTPVTGILKGDGTAMSAATAGTDYLAPDGSGAALKGITAAQVGADAAGLAAQAQANAESFATSAVGAETTRAEAAEALRVQIGGQLAGIPALPQVAVPDVTGGAWGVASDTAGRLASVQLLQGQDGSPLLGQDGSALGMPDTSTTVVPARPYGLAIGRGGCTVPVGIRSHSSIDGTLSSDTSATQTYRQFWPLSDPACGSVLPVFGQPWYGGFVSNYGDCDGHNPLTVACAVECSDGTILPFYFAGQRTVTIPQNDGVLVTPDYPIAFGQQVQAVTEHLGTLSGVWLRVYVSVPPSRSDSVTTVSGSPTVSDASILASDLGRPVSGTGIPANSLVGSPLTPGTSFTLVTQATATTRPAVNATASGTVTADISSAVPLNYGQPLVYPGGVSNQPNGADLTPQGSGAVSGTYYGAQYGPVALLGRPPQSRVPVVAQVSDSIFNGTTDYFIGPVQRGATALGYPFVKLSKFGEFAAVIASVSGRRYRQQWVPGCTHAIVELGTNDGLQSMNSANGVIGSLTAVGQWLSSLGVKAWLCTVCPRTTSTDNWETIANQTVFYPASVLSYFNGWVREVPAGYAGYIELGNLVSSAQDSGYWAVNGTPNYAAADGTHPSTAMMTGPIAAAVQSVMSAWTI